jgi:hypothetical protein
LNTLLLLVVAVGEALQLEIVEVAAAEQADLELEQDWLLQQERHTQ